MPPPYYLVAQLRRTKPIFHLQNVTNAQTPCIFLVIKDNYGRKATAATVELENEHHQTELTTTKYGNNDGRTAKQIYSVEVEEQYFQRGHPMNVT